MFVALRVSARVVLSQKAAFPAFASLGRNMSGKIAANTFWSIELKPGAPARATVI
jgi:hypothetical protein